MTAEAPNGDEKFNKFLEKNYLIKPDSVEETIKFAKAHKPEGISLNAHLMAQIGYIAEVNGIENLPVMLAAVWKIERDLPEDERRLTQKNYIGLLMKGELTSSKKELSPDNYKFSVAHAERADTLYQFWKKL